MHQSAVQLCAHLGWHTLGVRVHSERILNLEVVHTKKGGGPDQRFGHGLRQILTDPRMVVHIGVELAQREFPQSDIAFSKAGANSCP
jgi:hypothetical protein